MIFAGVGSPIGRATGLGLEAPVSAEELDRVEEFYRSRGAPSQVDVCPLTDPGLMTMLKERGYCLGELNNVLYRPLDPGEQFPPASAGVEIRPGRAEEAALLTRIVARSFFENGDTPEGFDQMLLPLFQMPGAVKFLALVEGNPAAGAAGLIIHERRMIALFGAGTLPEFRRRGIQTALLRTRLSLAAEAGCDLAVTVTQGGSTSQHNAERLGFRVAYSKATLVKNFEKN
jgi:GNAT superfamily N-acetyltransferase